MKKLSKLALGLSTSISTLFVAVNSAYASSWDSSSDAEGLLGLGFGLICWIPMCIIGLVTFAFTILMIIDVTKRDEKVLPNKTTWLILMAVGTFVGGWGFLVAIYYYFARKRKMGPAVSGGATREVS